MASIKVMKTDLSDNLNHQQKSASESLEGFSLILAGAGSGKTHTLIHKVIKTIHSGVAPEQILLLTFTNKAAREMIRRAELYSGKPIPAVTAGTFHGVANSLLRRFRSQLNLPHTLTIIDQDDAKKLIKNVIAEVVKEKDKHFPKPAALHSFISLARNKYQPLKDFLERTKPEWNKYSMDIQKIAINYGNKKRESDFIDFDDLLEIFLSMLRHPAVGQILKKQFNYIFVDEYQDTNIIQHEIINELAMSARALTVVGDDAQSIYSFRGAVFTNILNFQQSYPGAQIFKLEINYRSTKEILDLANAIIEKNINQYPKILTPAFVSEGELPLIIKSSDREEQAMEITARIRDYLESGTSPKEVAVLYRAHAHSLSLQLALSKENISYEIHSGLRFFEQAHLKDLLAFLRVLTNPLDAISWARIIQMIPGVGKKTADRIIDKIITQKDIIPTEIVYSQLKGVKKSNFAEIKDLYYEITAMHAPDQLIEKIFQTEYFSLFITTAYENASKREDDIKHLLSFAASYTSLEDFLADAALLGNTDREKKKSLNSVTLSTIHQSKGLEWDNVIIPWLVEEKFPAFKSMHDEESIEEERRLFYVAVTRARKNLLITFPNLDGAGRQMRYTAPSRFLTELPEELYRFEDNSVY